MIKVLIRVFPILLLLSCGISSSSYIIGATVISSTDALFKFEINSDSNSFTLYSRYYIGYDYKKSYFPDDLSISDTSGDSEGYVEDLGFTVVSFTLNIDETDETIDEFLISGTEIFIVEYDSTSNIIVSMNEIYYLISNHEDESNKLFSHIIGIYSDDEGRAFLKSFVSELDPDDSSISSIFIEFVIINTGISADSGAIETVESLPVYVTRSLEIGIN